jgi:hypothetical protein
VTRRMQNHPSTCLCNTPFLCIAYDNQSIMRAGGDVTQFGEIKDAFKDFEALSEKCFDSSVTVLMFHRDGKLETPLTYHEHNSLEKTYQIPNRI